MNLLDVFGAEINKETPTYNKIFVRTEEKEIQRYADKAVEEILRNINCKMEYVNRGCSYGSEKKLSDEEITRLSNMLKEQIKLIPSKLSEELKEIFGAASEEKKGEQKSSVETPAEQQSTEQTVVQQPSVTTSLFGY